jgi:serine phosphatase RsbU (regulator of sigma subunit)
MIFLFVIAIVLYFLATSYFEKIALYEQIQYDKMSAISNTLAQNIDGDLHQNILKTYKHKNDILSNEQDSNYQKIHTQLISAEKKNKTRSTIYTLVYNPIEKEFRYGVSSASKPFYRHKYLKFPPILKEKFRKGAIIPCYETENGIWISSFSPILNSDNEVVGVVEADVKFNEFISMARKNILKSSLISLFVILIIALFLYRSVKKILIQDEKTRQLLLNQKKQIEEKNQDITDSINYAKRIQDAILPTKEEIKAGINDFFILFKPRDIVSGDFYWYHRFEDGSQIIAVGDCTGHGIPGALVSVIGSSLLNEIVKQREIKDPGKILDLLDIGVSNGLGSNSKHSDQRDGMDISICYINSDKNHLTFSGAFRPLLLVRGSNMKEFKGDRFPIGGGDLYNKSPFSNINIEIEAEDKYFMFSDGLPDQFGGPKGKKLMTKKFKQILNKNIELPFIDQCNELEDFMNHWKGEHEQVDDIIVIGFTFP